jgi:hypothetical protein
VSVAPLFLLQLQCYRRPPSSLPNPSCAQVPELPFGEAQLMEPSSPHPDHQSHHASLWCRHCAAPLDESHRSSPSSTFWCGRSLLTFACLHRSAPELAPTTAPSSLIRMLHNASELHPSHLHFTSVCHRLWHLAQRVRCATAMLLVKTASKSARRRIIANHTTPRVCSPWPERASALLRSV